MKSFQMAGGMRTGTANMTQLMTADTSGAVAGRRVPDRAGMKTAEGNYNDLESVMKDGN